MFRDPSFIWLSAMESGMVANTQGENKSSGDARGSS